MSKSCRSSLRRSADSSKVSPPGAQRSKRCRPVLKKNPKMANNRIVLPKLASSSVTISLRIFSGPNSRDTTITESPKMAMAMSPGTESNLGNFGKSGSSVGIWSPSFVHPHSLAAQLEPGPEHRCQEREGRQTPRAENVSQADRGAGDAGGVEGQVA